MASVVYRQYTGERDLPHIISLVEHELSEPYVIYTYRYFLNQWYVFPSSPHPAQQLIPPHRPHLSFLVSPVPDAPCRYHVSPSRECSLDALCRLSQMTALTSPSAV
jgi:hypothetical protein